MSETHEAAAGGAAAETRGGPTMRLEARFAPRSLDAEARTVEVTWTTGAAVMRRDFLTGESWIEELEISERAIDLSRLNAGAPVLNTHRDWDLGDVIGVVERAWIERGEGRAKLRFSAREEVEPIFADIRAGIVRNVSVGYFVSEWKETRRDDGMRVRRAVRWQPAEISLVPVPADASAQVRAAEASATAALPGDPNPKEGRMAEPVVEGPVSPAQNHADTAAAVEQARAAERARIAALREVTETASAILDRAAAAALEKRAVDESWAPEQLRSALFEAIVAEGARVKAPPLTPVSRMGVSGDDPAALIDAMADAIVVRTMPGFRPATERYREFASLRPTDMLVELAQARGERVGPRNRTELIQRAFLSTSDFPLLLENAGNKMLEAGYRAAAPSFKTFFAQRPFNDFKEHKFLTAGDFPALEELAEGGNITAGSVSEKREAVRAKTYARQIRVTRQMLVDDDLGAFTDFGAMIGRRVAAQENALAYALMGLANGDGPTLAEGNTTVFGTAASRANKATQGGVVSHTTLGAGFAAMRRQRSLDGLALNITPRYLVCSPGMEFVAAQWATAAIVPDQAGNVNVFSGRYTVVSDANIPDYRWYLFADPAEAPVYVYGYVNGQSAPQIRAHGYVPGTDGLVLDVVHDFAVGAIDFRGAYYNPGAAPT
ncbi:hypothetical protein GCM10010964_43560 [Caldovatus sediminis]|uniref:Prohead serine protease domain-containing protein n=1 Tax=Caldovatus sediminis TaxID=2041189 RepID=A0A8J3ED22_9PROT|nr:prohead protease/major capsid protein fusion protein [Caldovatus sediminis]GGG51661.1 hypothetical protein GCM10010964_43560 [Caldovatus sediminis]